MDHASRPARTLQHAGRAATAAVLAAAFLAGCATTPATTGGGSGRPGTGPGGRELAGYGALERPVSPSSDVAAIARLSPDLREALRAAADEAAHREVTMVVTSGWRSAEYQSRLFDDALDTYGSEEEAMKWVLPPDRTKHVTGDAVDIGYTDGADWLGRFGNLWGLCQPFANEMWHFELLTEPGGTCPPQLSDAAQRVR